MTENEIDSYARSLQEAFSMHINSPEFQKAVDEEMQAFFSDSDAVEAAVLAERPSA